MEGERGEEEERGVEISFTEVEMIEAPQVVRARKEKEKEGETEEKEEGSEKEKLHEKQDDEGDDRCVLLRLAHTFHNHTHFTETYWQCRGLCYEGKNAEAYHFRAVSSVLRCHFIRRRRRFRSDDVMRILSFRRKTENSHTVL